MEDLENLLCVLLGETTFDVGKKQGDLVSYDGREEHLLQPDRLGAIFKENKWTPDLPFARRAKLVCPSALFSQLRDILRRELSDYIDSDTGAIGHVVPICNGQGLTGSYDLMLTDTRQVSSLTDFAEGLIKATTVVGVKTVVVLLDEWKNGEPVRFHASMLLKGVQVKRILEPMGGVYVKPLALSSDQLPADLPGFKTSSLGDYLGRSVLSVASLASSGLFHPRDLHHTATARVSHVTTIDISAVCQALALEYDTCVVQGWQWNHYPELPGFPIIQRTVFQDSGLSISPSSERHRPAGMSWSETGVALTGEAEPILEIDEQRLRANAAALQDADDHVRIAVERWMKSRGSGYPHDAHVDMRIALEALYLTNSGSERDRGELRFRVALRAAWHLGDSPERRREIFSTLRNAYDTGSKVVHTGKFVGKRPKGVSKQSFRHVSYPIDHEASELCRQGILKRLAKKKEPDWSKLVLGFPRHTV